MRSSHKKKILSFVVCVRMYVCTCAFFCLLFVLLTIFMQESTISARALFSSAFRWEDESCRFVLKGFEKKCSIAASHGWVFFTRWSCRVNRCLAAPGLAFVQHAHVFHVVVQSETSPSVTKSFLRNRRTMQDSSGQPSGFRCLSRVVEKSPELALSA